jgi:hypothetical protein
MSEEKGREKFFALSVLSVHTLLYREYRKAKIQGPGVFSGKRKFFLPNSVLSVQTPLY